MASISSPWTFAFRGARQVMLTALAGIGLLAGCSGDSPNAPSPPVAVSSVSTSPAQASLEQGATIQVQTVVRGVDGSTLAGRAVTWTTSDAAVATVSTTGLVTGTGHGSATVTAAVEGKTGSTSVTVRGMVASVTLSPHDHGMAEDSTIQLVAVATSDKGVVLSDRAVLWTTSDAAIATVSTTGLATGTGHGTATITATVEGKAGSASVTVRGKVASITVSPGSPVLTEDSTLQLSAVAKSRNGVVLSDRPTSWSSNSVAIAEVSPAGVVTGVTDGLAAVTATAEGRSTSVTVDVRGEVSSVTVSPAQASLNEPQAVTLTASVRSRKGTTLTRRSVVWSTSDPGIAAVVSSGTLSAQGTATGHGAVTLRGSIDGVAGTVALTVRGVVARIVVTPAIVHFVAGQNRSLTAQTFSRNDVLLTDRPMTWTTSDASVAALLAGQVAEAVSPGTATIRASAEAAVGTAAVAVHRILLGGASAGYTCAIVEGLASYCWGGNPFGTHGDGTLTSSSLPVQVATSAQFTALLPTEHTTYGVTSGGQVYMWGIRPLTGISAMTPEPNPTITGMAFVRLYGGSNFACGLGPDGLAYCWGQNENGQLGIGSTTSRLVPNLPVGAGLPLAALSLGGGHACGLTAAGKAYCWGINTYGELGDGTTNDRTAPVAVAPALSFVELAAGRPSTCGRTATHEVYCWGRLPGTMTDATTPTLIGTQPPLAAMVGGGLISCLLTTAGEARCWGANFTGAVGDGTATDRSIPTPVAGGLRFSTLSAGSDHACGVTFDQKMYCWGSNFAGQSGDGTQLNRFIPTRVQWPALP